MNLPKVNFLEIIDRALNANEWYFRTRFHDVGILLKSKPNEPGHLTLAPWNGSIPTQHFSYTTVCKKMRDYSIQNAYEPIRTEEVLVLQLPRQAKDYVKTWGKSDYVICKHTNGDTTTFFYLNAPKLLSYLEKALDAVDWNGEKIPRHLVHIEVLRIQGLTELGIVEMVDTYNAKTGYIHVEHNASPIPTPDHFRSGFCKTINLWENSKWTRPVWTAFELRKGQAAPAKPVVVTSLDTGRSLSYPSLTQAAASLTSLGKRVTAMQLTHCLKGRTKSFKTARGKCKVEYAATI